MDEKQKAVQTAFSSSARQYDKFRRQMVPCLDAYYQTAVRILPFETADSFRVLDLGAGTGLLSQFIHDRFPNAQITLLDFSEAMLEQSKERFMGKSQVEYHLCDYNEEELPNNFDAVVSALSIHHLLHPQKKALFKKIHTALRSKGVFINADQCYGETEAIESLYRQVWLEQLHQSGLTEEQLEIALSRSKLDIMATMSDQLKWLQEAGFEKVHCWFKNYSFLVYSGVKNI